MPPPPGLLSHGPLSLSNGAQVSGGSVESATKSGNVPLTMSGGAKIDLNFSYTANSKPPSFSNGAGVSGTIFPNVTAPVFPTVDPSVFSGFVPPAGSPKGAQVLDSTSVLTANQVFTNIRIKANANTSFGNSQVLNGVIFVESPNKVTFGGAVVINGIVVTDGNYSTPLNGNVLTFNNGVVVNGVETLNPSNFAASCHIDQLVKLSARCCSPPTSRPSSPAAAAR